MKICAISDSLTNELPDNWLALLAVARPDVEVVAEAHGGWTTKSYFKEKFNDVAFARVPPDAGLFILLIGSNDLFEDEGGSDASVAEAVGGVQRIADRALNIAPCAGILLAAPPTVAMRNVVFRITRPEPRRIDRQTPACLGRLSDAYRALAARRGWRFVDLFPLLVESDFADAAHPNAAGNRKIAAAMRAALYPIV